MIVWESLARPNRKELGEDHNDGVAVIILPISIGPVQPFHGSFHGVGVAGTTAFPSHRGPRDLLRLHGVNREVEAGRVILTNEGGKKPIELVKGNGDRKDLANGIREATNDPLGVAIDALADDGAGEETKRGIPTANKLGAVGGVRPYLGTSGSTDAFSQCQLKQSNLGRVGNSREGEVLGVATFTTTKRKSGDGHGKQE